MHKKRPQKNDNNELNFFGVISLKNVAFIKGSCWLIL